jgi:Na+-translocating ferredoxin:NAD+ oxidoreductase subunit A
MKLFELIVSASLVNNFVFTWSLGLCIFFGASKKTETAIGMSITFTAVMTISSAMSWLAFTYIMMPLGIEFLMIIIFMGIVAGLVQALDTIMRRISPGLYCKLGIYLGLISTNCVILAVPLMNAGNRYNFIESIAFALGSGLGFALAMIIMASIRERIELADIPKPFRGLPVAFIIAGMIALAFTGFSGLIAF